MKATKFFGVLLCSATLLAVTSFAGGVQGKTCCEKAAAKGKECTHKCCVAAHKEGKSCEKCNPQQQDLKLSKKHKAAKTAK